MIPFEVGYGFLFAFHGHYLVSFSIQSDILVENRDFSTGLYPTCSTFNVPVGGGFPSECCHKVWYGKTRILWLPDGERKFGDIFTR